MATLQERLTDLLGSAPEVEAAKDALNAGARLVVDMMPAEVLEEHSVPENVSVSGVDISNCRIHYAHKGGYGARKILPELRTHVQDSASIHYALPTDPVYVVYNGKIYIYPSGGTVMKIDYPAITTVTASTITGINTRLVQIVVYYAAIQLMYQNVYNTYSDIDALEDQLPDTPEVNEIDPPDFSDSTISATLTTDDLPSSPVYGAPDIPEFGGSFTELATALDAEEDISLAEAHMGRLSQYLNKYRADMENEFNEFREELEVYNKAYELKYKIAEEKLTVAIKNQDYALQKEIAEFKAWLDRDKSFVEVYATSVAGWASLVRAKLEVLASQVSMIDKLHGELKILLQVHLGVK